MELMFQVSSLEELKKLASNDRHSILISGSSGCGKTYLAKQFANYLNIQDFQIIHPKVDELKSSMEECLHLDTPILLCIENLDTGVPAASYALLKFLEEPTPNVYIAVTVRNVNDVPDTILSRCAHISCRSPLDSDISKYGNSIDSSKWDLLVRSNKLLASSARSLTDVDTLISMSLDHQRYFEDLGMLAEFKDNVSNIVWKLQHYPDSSETPIELVIRYVSMLSKSRYIERCGIECIRSLSQSRIASHAVLAKFAFNCKYCE